MATTTPGTIVFVRVGIGDNNGIDYCPGIVHQWHAAVGAGPDLIDVRSFHGSTTVGFNTGCPLWADRDEYDEHAEDYPFAAYLLPAA
jgi:hypothetical protein